MSTSPTARHTNPRRHSRAEAALLARCRAGDPEALEVLAFRLAEPLWRASLTRGADVETRRAAALDGLRAALRALKGWHVASLAHLERRAAAAAGGHPPEVPGSDAASSLAPAILDDLRVTARAAAAELREAATRRAFWRLQAYAVIAALVLGTGMLGVGYIAMTRTRSIPGPVLDGLTFRIRHQGLSVLLRDLAWELAEQGEEAQRVAAALEEASLALDEIASARSPADSYRLRYVGWRARQRGLSQLVASVADESGIYRAAVMDAALILEEVENWFAPR